MVVPEPYDEISQFGSVTSSDRVPLHFVLKVAARCNLNCSYCYVYNKGDTTWRDQPAFMADDVFDAAVLRIRRYCEHSGQGSVTVTFHGGEPCLLGPERFADCCLRLREGLGELVQVRLVVQTNGTFLNERWAEVFRDHRVDVGVSVDGPKWIHDAHRVDHGGRGSYDRIARGINILHHFAIPISILSVIQLGSNGLEAHRHLARLRPQAIDYLLPDFTHDSIAPVREAYGPTPCADYLVPIFDNWLDSWPSGVMIRLFWNIVRLVLGGESQVDLLGNGPLGFVFVETDGSIEGLDVLRVCRNGMAQTGLNVLVDDFSDIAARSPLHGATIFSSPLLPSGCRRCPERDTCAGGYLPHRYSALNGFDNPSVWCADLLALFGHVRRRLGVPFEETALRRRVLEELVNEPIGA
jgi:uncharacterized protein